MPTERCFGDVWNSAFLPNAARLYLHVHMHIALLESLVAMRDEVVPGMAAYAAASTFCMRKSPRETHVSGVTRSAPGT